jgi:hypothetical protein
MLVEYLTPAIEDRAVEVLMALAHHGQHRAASIPRLHNLEHDRTRLLLVKADA